MEELMPVIAGVLVGLLVQYRIAPRWKAAVTVVLSLLLGLLASLLAGELALSWGFVLIDIAQVIVAAAITVGVITWRQRRAATSR